MTNEVLTTIVLSGIGGLGTIAWFFILNYLKAIETAIANLSQSQARMSEVVRASASEVRLLRRDIGSIEGKMETVIAEINSNRKDIYDATAQLKALWRYHDASKGKVS